MSRIAKLKSFFHIISHSVTIDLSSFSLGSGTKEVKFRFVDPLWGWLMAARKQHPLDLHWEPVRQDPVNPVYGGGVEYGKNFLEACSSCPPGSYPMCVSLHWDGTSGRGMSAAPIQIGVTNTNVLDLTAEFCIGYMPYIADFASKPFRNTEKATDVKFYLRNRCAAAILHVLDTAAVSGVKCRLFNRKNADVVRLLYPRLTAMNFDQPEAQLFFGMQNKQSCSTCIRRKGYSAFRRGSQQTRAVIRRLYAFANDSESEHRTMAREKLRRFGFNYKRYCCVHRVSDHLLVRLPTTDPVFPCVDTRDCMHGIMMFTHRVIMEALVDINFSAKVKQTMDARLACVSQGGHFRDGQGRVFRVQKTIFDDVGMTAVDKVHHVFFLAHVLGPTADIIPDPRLRQPILTAVAWAQLMNIAVRGLRSYTEMELRTIFDKGYIVLFGALETVREINYLVRCQAHQKQEQDRQKKRNDTNKKRKTPDTKERAPKKPPKKFKPTDR